MMTTKWDIRFLQMARFISTWSKDPSTKCGAVIVRPDRTIASLGYNGFPKNMNDVLHDYENREIKYDKVIHAEMNALIHVKESIEGHAIYTYPFISCNRCAVHLVQAGIVRSISITPSLSILSRWKKSIDSSHAYFQECYVITQEYPESQLND